MPKKKVTAARTVFEANERGHAQVHGLSLKKIKPSVRSKGVEFSKKYARPGDIAFYGICENNNGVKTRIVCYYDANMDPSDCRNEPC